jgi:hypothetical protein
VKRRALGERLDELEQAPRARHRARPAAHPAGGRRAALGQHKGLIAIHYADVGNKSGVQDRVQVSQILRSKFR